MKIINLELFGHPVNVLTILVCVGLFWFACFKLAGTGAFMSDDAIA